MPTPADEAVAKFGQILAHPLRVYLLRAALKEGEITTVELAKRDGADRVTLAYHCRVLTELGGLKIVRAEPRGGVMGHWYGIDPGVAKQLRSVLRAFA